MAEKNEKETCQPEEVEKRKRDMAILEELTELAKVRARHNLTFVGQEEGDVADRAGEELEKDIADAEKCLNDKKTGKKEQATMMRQKPAEITELWETAKYREIASGAFYTAGQSRTLDPGARALMKELAAEEAEHYRRLDEFQTRGELRSRPEKVKDLMDSEYLTGGETLMGAGLQDTLIFAIKREQESVEFYTRMTAVMVTGEGKALCQRLAEQELNHKVKLELLYENLFLKED